ncbi:TonB-dependent receptor [Sphingomonas sp. LY29]|uniref:TonB-dependent receptor plug domain-containing protein n=1 Tax=Sphingomonas sp. LY29 TaxID=3095341 RepID=UPI002D777A12|nr:TonB-dependent receptor [Sphingomonas sp. LY29]WRP26855.1 TonB-dependent receptor [Sphingomonas sp. LY29]
MTVAYRSILLAGLSTFALAMPAKAQVASPPPTTSAETTPTEQTIIVTGTRRSDRTVADSPVPIDVIGSDAITNTGATETNKILNQLVPSFNFPQPSIADGSDALRPATLRGLSPDQTLVLINGKRRHLSALLNINGTVGRGSAAVDLNLIPGLSIDRIEVLRDGASSQYGSDAIAGVINIQLKRANRGGRASVTYGKYYTTVDNVRDISGLQLSPTGQPQLDPADTRYFLADSDGDRKARDGAQLTAGVNLGLPVGTRGFVNGTFEFRDRNDTNRSGYDLRPNYNRPTAAFDSREVSFDRLNFRFGDPNTRDYNVIVNAGYDLTEVFELYAFGSYGHRRSESAANYRQQNAATNRDFSTIAPNQTPNAGNFVPLTPDGFLPLIDTTLKDYALTGGVRGDVAGWKADLSLGTGHNKFDYQINDTLNTSFGPQSQSSFDAGGLRYGQVVANLDFSNTFAIGLFKPLSVAVGAEYRHENFKIRPGELQSYAIGPFFRPSVATTAANCTTQQGVYNGTTGICSFPGRTAAAGAQGFPGIPDTSRTDESRHSYAAYAELDVDPIEGLTTTLAGRYERFSDFGSTWNGKFAARFEPVAGYAIRGSISNGFRAPSLHQQFFTTTSTNFIGGVPVDISTVAVDSPVAQALGSRPLKPEKSVNISLGATANPMRGLTLTADIYKISIDDRIVLTENLGAAGSGTAAQNTAVKAILDANGFQSVGAARFFINGLDTTTKGIDVVAAYRFGTADLGRWTLTAAYNYNKTKIDKRLNALGPLATIPGLVLFGRVEGIRFTDGQPRDKVVLSADGDIGNFGVTARTTRYGKVVSPGAVNPISDPTSLTALGPDDIKLGRKWITDLEGRYKIGKIELAVGANNLFDIYPDRSPFGPRPASVGGVYPANQIYIPYSIFSPFGFNGRFLYGRASIDF